MISAARPESRHEHRTLIAALWIAFAVSHMVLSSRRLRPRIVAALGRRSSASRASTR
jgi:hypothetical protein